MEKGQKGRWCEKYGRQCNDRPVLDVVRKLVEFSELPRGNGGPTPCTNRARAVVESLCVLETEVDEQEDEQEGGQQQIYKRHPPIVEAISHIEHQSQCAKSHTCKECSPVAGGGGDDTRHA